MSNRIHPTVIIGHDVEVGDGNVIGPYAVVIGPGSIGDGNYIGSHVAIGAPGEIRGGRHGAGWDDGHGGMFTIGSETVIREHVTVQVAENSTTSIGDNCYLMTKSHVPHHARVADNATVACLAVIGGHGRIGEGAYLGLSSVLHQRLAIGVGAIIGMGAVVTKHIPPFAMAFGGPARIRGANVVGMQRRGIGADLIDVVDAGYKEGMPAEEIFSLDALGEIAWVMDEWRASIEVANQPI
jgi:UDP-N-acetylglucosamine acyltransferase